jgi:hypothetical protein
LLRIITDLEIMVEGHHVSRKISAVAVVVAGALCVWLWMLSSRASQPAPDSAGAPPPA